MAETKPKKKTYYEEVAQKFAQAIKENNAPWQKPWSGGMDYQPHNPTTGKRYRGVNSLNLFVTGQNKQFTDTRWMTYKQAQRIGAQVRKGEKGTTIQFWKSQETIDRLDQNGNPIIDPKTGKPEQVTVQLQNPTCFYSTVFNGEQIDGLPPIQQVLPEQWNPIEAVESLVQNYGIEVKHAPVGRAFYRQSDDSIQIPERGMFDNERDYYLTLLHEVGHSTGIESRLNREEYREYHFKREARAKEELVAEISAFQLGALTGLGHEPSENSISYVSGWLEALEKDPRFILQAASAAEKVASFLEPFMENTIVREIITPEMVEAYKNEQEVLLDLKIEKQEPRAVEEENAPQIPKQIETRAYLDVPYSEKEEAKALGAKWDKIEKAWYVSAEAPKEPLRKWLHVEGLGEDYSVFYFDNQIGGPENNLRVVLEDYISEELARGGQRYLEVIKQVQGNKETYVLEYTMPDDEIFIIEGTRALTEKQAIANAVRFVQQTHGEWFTVLSAKELEEIAEQGQIELTAEDREKLFNDMETSRLGYRAACAEKKVEYIEVPHKDQILEDMRQVHLSYLESYKKVVVSDVLHGLRGRQATDEMRSVQPQELDRMEELGEKIGDIGRKETLIPTKDNDLQEDIDRLENLKHGEAVNLMDVINDIKDKASQAEQQKTSIEKEFVAEKEQERNAQDAEKQERQYLDVPYPQRHAAKKAGAKWDAEAKSWYVGENADKAALSRWTIDENQQSKQIEQNPREEFAMLLQDMGCKLSGEHPIMDGSKHRIEVDGDQNGMKSGFYVGHLDGRPAGYVMNNRTGEETRWKSTGQRLSNQEKSELKQKSIQKQAEREQETQEKQQEAKKRLEYILLNSTKAKGQSHPYAEKKGIELTEGAFITTQGTLCVPAMDVKGEVWTAQYIMEDGSKRFAANGKRDGCFHPIGGSVEAFAKEEVILISEGYSTGVSVSEVTKMPVAVAFSSNNLKEVAIALQNRFPDKPIIFLADDDKHLVENPQIRKNVGIEAAKKAAEAVNGTYVFPRFANGEQEQDLKGFCDFNDLATKSKYGKNGIKFQMDFAFDKAIKPTQEQKKETTNTKEKEQEQKKERKGIER